MVAAIVLSRNGWDITAACCRSLARQMYRELRIWVVGNGATLNTTEDLELICPEAMALCLEEHPGCAAGMNEGIRAGHAAERINTEWLRGEAP